MADVVTTTVLENGPRRFVAQFTNLSDGTGETGVVKINATSSGTLGVTIAGVVYFPGVHLKINDLWYDIGSMKLRIQWVASVNTDCLVLSGFGHWPLTDRRAGFQGLINPNNAGATGSIAFTTVGAALNSSYTVILECVKGIPQSAGN